MCVFNRDDLNYVSVRVIGSDIGMRSSAADVIGDRGESYLHKVDRENGEPPRVLNVCETTWSRYLYEPSEIQFNVEINCEHVSVQ